jgi:hypothetical protein
VKAYLEYSDPRESRNRGCRASRVDIPIGLRNFELNLLRVLSKGYDVRYYTDFHRASKTVCLSSQEPPNKGYSHDL